MQDQRVDLKEKLLESGRVFPIEDARDIADTLWHYTCIDTQDRFHDTFFHEICPLILIAEYVGATRLKFEGGNARFDGRILATEWQNVELTAAIDGYQEAFRMELLDKQGHAPAFDIIKATGPKGNRQFSETDGEAVNSAQYGQSTLCTLIEKALNRKRKKTSGNPYYHDAWLGIVFNDEIVPLKDRKKNWFDPPCQHVIVTAIVLSLACFW